MLEQHARVLLDIIGKEPAKQGVITVEQIPAAIAAIEARCAAEKANAHNNDDYAVEGHDETAEKQHISLCQRATPLLHMLKDSLADDKNVMWEA